MVTIKTEKAAGMSYPNTEHNNHVIRQIKYEVNTLGITAKALKLNYDDLVLMASIKKQVEKHLK